MGIARILRSMLRGELLVFLGAGASVGENAAPSGTELSARIRDELTQQEASECTGLPDIASRVEAKIGRHELISLLTDYFASASATTEFHRNLALLPVKTIVTTNYDLFMEHALDEAGVPYQRLCAPTDLMHISSDRTSVLKLHGSLDVDDQLSPLIITTCDFYKYSVSGRSVSNDLLRAWLISKTCLFIGFALRDPDFLQLFFYTQSLLDQMHVKEDRMFAVQLHPHPLDVKTWSDLGIHVIDQSSDDFMEELINAFLNQFYVKQSEDVVIFRQQCTVSRVPRDLLGKTSEEFGHHHRFIALPTIFKRDLPAFPPGTWVNVTCGPRTESAIVVYDSRISGGIGIPRQLRTALGIQDGVPLDSTLELRVEPDTALDSLEIPPYAYLGHPDREAVDEYYSTMPDGAGPMFIQMRRHEFERMGLRQYDNVEISYGGTTLLVRTSFKKDDSLNAIFLPRDVRESLGLSGQFMNPGTRTGAVVVRKIWKAE